MRNYEIVLITVHEATDERQKELLGRLDAVFTKLNVTVKAQHDRGKRILGYKMKKHKEGHLYVYDVQADPAKAASLEREIRLVDAVLQVMISHPVKPAKTPVREAASVGR